MLYEGNSISNLCDPERERPEISFAPKKIVISSGTRSPAKADDLVKSKDPYPIVSANAATGTSPHSLDVLPPQIVDR